MTDDFTPVFPRSVDNTMISCFDSCPQKFFDEFCVRISPSGVSPDLHAGGAFAHGMESTRRALYQDNATLIEALGQAYFDFTQFWGLYEPPRSNPKTYIATFCAIVDYFREYPPHDDSLQPHRSLDGNPSLEFTIAEPLPINHPVTGDPLLYSGRFDMLALDTSTDLLCVLDEKTTKAFYKNWAGHWSMHGQFIGYVWATQQYDLPCEHYCVRGIAIQKTQYQHLQHGPVRIPQYHIDDWYYNMLEKVHRMVNCWNDMICYTGCANPHTHWPKSFGDACSSYNGCSYVGICTQPDPRRWYYDFERRFWDPLAKNPTALSEQPLLDLAGMTLEQLGARYDSS